MTKKQNSLRGNGKSVRLEVGAAKKTGLKLLTFLMMKKKSKQNKKIGRKHWATIAYTKARQKVQENKQKRDRTVKRQNNYRCRHQDLTRNQKQTTI
jgi:hypothetical protein